MLREVGASNLTAHFSARSPTQKSAALPERHNRRNPRETNQALPDPVPPDEASLIRLTGPAHNPTVALWWGHC